MQNKTQKVGLITATSLVVGNMIGAGIYVLPATLAGYGSVTLVGWLLTALGAIFLAKIFGNFRPGIQQRCRVLLLGRDDRLARRYSRTGVFAMDGSNPDTTTLVA